MTDNELLNKKFEILNRKYNELHTEIQDQLCEIAESNEEVRSMCKFMKERMLFETVVSMIRGEKK